MFKASWSIVINIRWQCWRGRQLIIQYKKMMDHQKHHWDADFCSFRFFSSVWCRIWNVTACIHSVGVERADLGYTLCKTISLYGEDKLERNLIKPVWPKSRSPCLATIKGHDNIDDYYLIYNFRIINIPVPISCESILSVVPYLISD